MKTKKEVYQFLQKELIDKKNESRTMVQTVLAVIFVMALWGFVMFCVISYFHLKENTENWIILISLVVLASILLPLVDKILRSPFGPVPFVSDEEISFLAQKKIESFRQRCDSISAEILELSQILD